jgi:magnesium transporter
MLFAEYDEPPRTASLIGIAFAISGNIVISLALNAQKLAHRRIEEAGTKTPPRRLPSNPPSSADDVLLKRYQSSRLSGQKAHLDTSPLKPRGSSFARYGAAVSSRLNPLRRARVQNDSAPTSEPPEGSDPSLLHPEHEESEDEERPLLGNGGIEEEDEEGLRDFDEVLMDADEIPEARSESAYLKSKLW